MTSRSNDSSVSADKFSSRRWLLITPLCMIAAFCFGLVLFQSHSSAKAATAASRSTPKPALPETALPSTVTSQTDLGKAAPLASVPAGASSGPQSKATNGRTKTSADSNGQPPVPASDDRHSSSTRTDDNQKVLPDAMNSLLIKLNF